MTLLTSATWIEWIIFGLLLLILFSTNVFTFLYNRHLRAYNKQLIEKVSAPQQEASPLPVDPPETDTLDEDEDSIDAGSDIIEVVGGELSENINRAIEETEKRLKQLDIEDTELPPGASNEAIAAAMRFHFLESEKVALPFSKEPDMIWNTLQPHYDKIIGLIHGQAGAASADSADKETVTRQNEQISELSSQLADSQAQQQATQVQLDGINSEWNNEYPDLQECYDKIIQMAPTGDPVVLETADLLFNKVLSIGGKISGQSLETVDSSGLSGLDKPVVQTEATQSPKSQSPKKEPPVLDTEAIIEIDSTDSSSAAEAVEEASGAISDQLDSSTTLEITPELAESADSLPTDDTSTGDVPTITEVPHIDETMQALDDLFEENVEDQSETNNISDDIDNIIQEIDHIDNQINSIPKSAS